MSLASFHGGLAESDHLLSAQLAIGRFFIWNRTNFASRMFQTFDDKVSGYTCTVAPDT